MAAVASAALDADLSRFGNAPSAVFEPLARPPSTCAERVRKPGARPPPYKRKSLPHCPEVVRSRGRCGSGAIGSVVMLLGCRLKSAGTPGPAENALVAAKVRASSGDLVHV